MKPIETVHIVGMGALGMLYGSLIARTLGSGCVRFVMDDDRYARHAGKTHRVNGEEVELPLLKASQATPCDLVIVAVKGPALEAALDTMANSVGEDTTIISVLNGISSEEIIEDGLKSTVETFTLEYMIYQNNGTFRTDVGSDAIRKQHVVVSDREGDMKIDSIVSHTYSYS